MRIKQRGIALVLCLTLVVSMLFISNITVFAADISAGQEVEITIGLRSGAFFGNLEPENFYLFYDIDDFQLKTNSLNYISTNVPLKATGSFTYDKTDYNFGTAGNANINNKTGARFYIHFAYSDVDKTIYDFDPNLGGTFNADEDLFKVTLVARRPVSLSGGEITAHFEGPSSSGTAYADYDTIGGGGSQSAAYTVSAESSAEPTVNGANFTVDVKVAGTTPFASSKVGFTYDPDKVTFLEGTSTLTANSSSVIVTAENGVGTITRTGTAVPTGSPWTLATLTFTPIAAGDAEFAITAPQVGVQGDPNALTDADGAGIGDSAIVTIGSGSSSPTFTVAVDNNWKGAPTGYSLITVVADDDNDGHGYLYDGTPLFYSDNISAKRADGKKVFLTIISGTPNQETAAGYVTEGTTGTYTTITYDGKLNSDNEADIFDAQIAFDLSTGSYYISVESLTTLSIEKRLAADYNGDGVITPADALAIQKLYHGITD